MKNLLLSLGLAGALLTSSAHALTCYLLTPDNKIVTFDSASPGGAGAGVSITGLVAGDEVVGIDVRTTVQPNSANPGVGSLWALARNGTDTRVYVINPATGAATQIGGTLTGIQSGSSGWFFGFDPARDRIRILNFLYNYELNPNTITYVQQTNLQGFFPNSDGSAFTTAPYGGTSQIYFVDQNPNDSLRTSTNIASGVTSVVGDLGIPFTTGAGLDIAGNLTLFAYESGGASNLYSVNRSTGAATLIGTIAGNPTTRALAIRPATFPGRASISVKIKGPKAVSTTSASRVIRGTVKSNAGIGSVEYRVGTKGKFKKVKGKLANWKFTAKLKPGKNVISVRAKVGTTTSKIAKVTVTRE